MNETLSHFFVNKNFKNNLFFPLGFCHIKSTWFQNLCWNRLRATGTSPYFSNCLVCLPVLWEVNVVWASYSFSSSRVDIQGLLGSLSLCGRIRPRSGWFVFSIGPVVPGLLFQGWKPQVWTMRQKDENKNVKKKVKWHFVGLSTFCLKLGLSSFGIPAINI